MWAVSLALQLTTWERAPGAFDRNRGWSQSHSERFEEEKQTLTPHKKVT